MHGEEAPVCEKCGAKALERLISLSSFRLTGKGWYTTDYNGKNASTQK
jgi:predicted nucleic acid-binding Zn ribbon protein